MPKSLFLYSDGEVSNFGPLTELHPAADLRCGALTLSEKFLQRLNTPPLHINSLGKKKNIFFHKEHSALLINDRAFISAPSIKDMHDFSDNVKFVSRGKVLAVYLTGERLQATLEAENTGEYRRVWRDLNAIEIQGQLLEYPWQLLELCGAEIIADLTLIEQKDSGVQPTLAADVIVRGVENVRCTGEVSVGPGVIIDVEHNRVRLEAGVKIEAGAVLNASAGPVWLAKEAVVQTGALLSGPIYIGPNSIVRPGARLNGNVTLGPQCRVGGEISNVIIQGYSNKQHSGYLGAAYLGEWINLGAATDNSDLKNNYRPVEVMLNHCKVNSGSLHIGVFLGDYVRTAIGSRLNSGTTVGTCCNIFGVDFPDKTIPPFIWFGSDGYQEYRLDKALQTVEVVMSRRGVELSPQRQEQLTTLFERSAEERMEFLRVKNKQRI